MRAGFDLDGCKSNFGDEVRAYLNSIGREYGYKDGAPEPHVWNFFEYWGMDTKEFVQVCNDGVDAGYIFRGPLRPNAAESVRRVKELGHEVIIITDRFFGTVVNGVNPSHTATTETLALNNIEYDELIFSADKTIVPTDVFVEDKIENYDALVENGTVAFLINRPWNQVPGGDARNRIDDIKDYADAIEKMTLLDGFVDLQLV